MPNIIDYLNWRGDLTFKQTQINEVDNIILARFSYLPFKEINMEKIDNIANISNQMKDVSLDKFIWKDDKEFIIKLAQTKRYKDLIVTDYKEIMDLEAEKQFAAVTIWIPKGYKYISFRGTDMSLVGWKEDFNMSFMQNIPSQLEAVKYLNEVGSRYMGKLIVGGHSKGGNLAIYASMFCKKRIQNKIVQVINADGPGFDESIFNTENHIKTLEKLKTYIPQSSIIGRLLEHDEDYEIIHSTQKGIMQHDIYSWQVNANSLVRIPSLTNDSQFVNKVVREWLKNTTPEQRKNFVNVIYDVLIATEAKSVHDFGIDTLKKVATVIKSYKNIDKEERKEIEAMIKLMFESAVKTVKDKRKEDVVWNYYMQQEMKINTN